MRVLLSGGGTGGHIYPALAIAEEMRRLDPNTELLYVGTASGREAELVPKTGIPFATLPVKGMPRKLSPAVIPFGIALLQSLSGARKILKQFNPDIVIGTGGFVSGPILYRAAKAGKSTLIHEQNSYPGIANRLLSKYVDQIAITFEESASYLGSRGNQTLTGNPVRSAFFSLRRTEILYEKYGLISGKPTVLIFGGSNGHEELNDAVGKMLSEQDEMNYQAILVTGPDHYDAFKGAFGSLPAGAVILPYAWEIDELYAISDLIVTSAGAITLAEIHAAGLAAILVPKSYTTENHQVKNAWAVAEKGAALVVEEKDLSASRLREDIHTLLDNSDKLNAMKEASKAMGRPHAAQDIVKLALSGWERKKQK